METHAAVRRGDDVAAVRAPRLDDAVDRAWIEMGSVSEDDDSRVDVPGKRREPAAQRSPGPELPPGAADDARVRVELVRAGHDDEVVDGACAQRCEHVREKRLLLRGCRAVARRRSGGEDDAVDQLHPAKAAQRSSTFAT
jgi:hypothetical protein